MPTNKKRPIEFYPYLLKQYNDRWVLIGAADSNKKTFNYGKVQLLIYTK